MKQKVSVQLSNELFDRLEAATEQASTTRTAVIETALNQYLSSSPEALSGSRTIDDATLLRRLDWMSHQLEQLERELRIVNETVALHARFHLTVTPPIPQSQQRAACLFGVERFEVFAAQVGRRVHLGTPLMRETMDRLSATNPDLFASEVEEGAPLGAQPRDSVRHVSAATAANAERPPSAAAREDGSNGGFPADRSGRSR